MKYDFNRINENFSDYTIFYKEICMEPRFVDNADNYLPLSSTPHNFANVIQKNGKTCVLVATAEESYFGSERMRLGATALSKTALTLGIGLLSSETRANWNGFFTGRQIRPVYSSSPFLVNKFFADGGDSDAQYELGLMYASGKDVKQDDQKAMEYFGLAADQGNTEAQYQLGLMYASGKGAGQDEHKITKYIELVADQGNTEAQYRLGLMYRSGQGVKQDDQKAIAYFKLAADQGNTEAQYQLGLIYQSRQGVEQDDQKATAYFKMAADQRNPKAQYQLGLAQYELGRSMRKSVKYKPEYSGVRKSGFEKASECFMEAAKYFKLAADQGNVEAQYQLGLMYERKYLYQIGALTPPEYTYLKLAADQGHTKAQYQLGEMFRKLGSPQAVEYFKLAANGGDAKALYRLGVMYSLGNGVEQDNQQAVKYLELASDQGNAKAQCQLGMMYASGQGVKQDDQQAVKYFKLAAENGSIFARHELERKYKNILF